MHERALLGRAAEEAAAAAITRRGYVEADRNWADRWGELDLVFRNRDEVVFVEVRSRRNGTEDDAADSIGKDKRSRVRGTAQRYLDQRPVDYREVRFFAATVVWRDGVPRVTVVEDAF